MELFDAIFRGIVAICAMAAGIYSWLTHRKAKTIDDAVNHTHAGQPRIYDLAQNNASNVEALASKVDDLASKVVGMDNAVVLLQQVAHDLVDWKNSMSGTPLDTSAKVIEFVNKTDQRLEAVEQMIAHHVTWEEASKYNELTGLLVQLRAAVTDMKAENDRRTA